MDGTPVILEHTFDAQISRVWKAITDKNEMKHWYFDLKEFKPEVGFIFNFSGGPDGGKQYLHMCEVTSTKANELLSYTWKYEGYKGESEVIFELTDQVDQTVLKLTHRGLETFPSTNPDFAIHNFVEGWHHIIHNALKAYLEKDN